MVPRGDQPRVLLYDSEFGALTGTNLTATLNEPLPEIVRKIDVDEQIVHWSDKINCHTSHIGTLALHQKLINSLTPDSHGGNMDCRHGAWYGDVSQFRVEELEFHWGRSRLSGDGEVCGVAVEYPTFTTFTVNVIKNYDIEWPRLDDDFIMAIGSTRPLEDA